MSKTKEKNSAAGKILDITLGMLLAKVAERGLKRTRKLMFRWRRALAPLWFGFWVWLVSVVWRWQFPEWWALVLAVPVLGLGLAWFGPKITGRWARVIMALVPAGLDKGKDGVLDRPVERVYFGSLTTLLGLYMVLRIHSGPSELSMWVWVSGVVLWGGAWWYHRRVRVVGRADKFVKKWPTLADKETCPYRLTPLVGSKVVSAQARGRTSVLTVELASAQTADALAHLTGALASEFKLRMGSVFMAAVPEKAHYVKITFLPDDPWKGKIPHPLPEPGSISLALMHKKFPMGLLAHGVEMIYELQHTLVVGSTGSGKSGWLHSLMSWLVAFTDTVVVGIDMAAGATLGMWRKALALPLATDVVAAVEILKRVLGVIADRESKLGLANEDDDDDADSFEPSDRFPWLVLVIDEFPDLLAEAKMTKTEDGGTYLNQVLLLLGRIAKKARKCGVRLILASQNGTKLDLGSKEMQAQLRAVVGLALDSQQSRNLWGTLAAQGWKSTDLGLGQFLLRDDDHSSPEIAKGFWTEKKERWTQIKKAAALHKELEPSANAILMGLSKADDYIDAEIVEETQSQTQTPTQTQALGLGETKVLEYLRVSGPANAETVIKALTEAKTEADNYGTSRARVFLYLKTLAELGLVRSDNGSWTYLGEAGGAAVPVQRKTESAPGTEMVSIQGEQMR